MNNSVQKAKDKLERATEECDKTDFLQKVCDILVQQMESYSWVGIYLVKEKKLHLAAWQGPQPTEHTIIDVTQGICGLAVREERTVVVDDVSSDDRYISCFISTRSEIVVPISKNGNVIGEIDVDCDMVAAFDNNDIEFLEWLAGEIGEKL
ncbi:MAG TPA: GAF domain-containing protein [Euryarchaeota archaeon]|nr:GAF domain-containing protein [Euryarchaeota archaeon]